MGMPPYVVFGDTALDEMARVRPASIDGFARIKGVGLAKLEQFGERFVAAIGAYCREHGLALDAAAGSRMLGAGSSAGDGGGGRPVLVIDDAAPRISPGSKGAAAMFARGSSVEEVAAATGRAASTVRGYLEDFVRETKPGSIGAWVDAGTYARVAEAFEKTGGGGGGGAGGGALKPAFEELGGEVGYDVIRLVLTHRRAVGAGSLAGDSIG